MTMHQKDEERVWKLSFLAWYHFKAVFKDLYRYLFYASVRIILDCIVFLMVNSLQAMRTSNIIY